MPETILCAAIKVGELVLSVPRPHRHHSIINEFYLLYGRRIDRGVTVSALLEDEQGFLTSKGRFVGRKEAWVIAAEAGQVTHPAGNDGPETGITSESMW